MEVGGVLGGLERVHGAQSFVATEARAVPPANADALGDSLAQADDPRLVLRVHCATCRAWIRRGGRSPPADASAPAGCRTRRAASLRVWWRRHPRPRGNAPRRA